MIDEKPWYQSKTIWGGIVALGSAAAGNWGVKVDAASGDALVLALTSAATAVGAVLAIIGRVTADTAIRKG
ncbi:hypothetical protein [Mangrovibrevibacter kandeliae]|uniref:hypothetical protein n=1 Tax=Mangrovibrevibacter kandeliae TaxID=2968473 RepID=UPI002117E5D9|nr:hypothetical protein [Aurantimonas sp. CSK15Z-1]MCQ8781091.1 hypothetical protein [Aurantimonas sp. CSK15Z-1]